MLHLQERRRAAIASLLLPEQPLPPIFLSNPQSGKAGRPGSLAKRWPANAQTPNIENVKRAALQAGGNGKRAAGGSPFSPADGAGRPPLQSRNQERSA